MKHILDNLSHYEKMAIIEQHKGGMKVSNDKFRKLLTEKLGNVRPLLNEQDTKLDPMVQDLIKRGYKETQDINLPDGIYSKAGSGYQVDVNSQDGKYTGYSIIVHDGIRGMWSGTMNITGKKPNTNTYKIMFKESGYKPQAQAEGQQASKSIVTKVATQGIINVTSEMISSPPFEGTYSGYVFGGNFNGVDYQWDCSGVEGMFGTRGMVSGQIISDVNSRLHVQLGQRPSDIPKDPNGAWVGFYSDNTKFLIYTSSSGTIQCLQFG